MINAIYAIGALMAMAVPLALLGQAIAAGYCDWPPPFKTFDHIMKRATIISVIGFIMVVGAGFQKAGI